MKLNNVKRTIAASALGLVALLGTTEVANAQSKIRAVRQEQRQERRIERQQQRIYTQQQQIARQRAILEQQRYREEQIRLQNQRNRQYQRNGNVYSNNNVYRNNRYRVYRNGSYYNTDNRGAQLLRQAVNSGYQQGVRAGQIDRSNRRNGNYRTYTIYRDGNYGYQSYVDSQQYQYYFQQGFERGYQDGYNSRYQYGTNNNGSFNILGTILSAILNLQSY
jgi:hypothetical protein